MKDMVLLIRREFWEHRAFVIAPAIVAGIYLLVALVSGGYFGDASHDVELPPELMDAYKQEALVIGALGLLSTGFLITAGIIVVFYLLDSLYADRKDRSVLFWKSMPVSDAASVTSKLATAALVVPLLAFGAILVTNLLVGVIAAIRLELAGIEGAWDFIWNARAWFMAHVVLLYSIVAAMIWCLPILAWLLLASAWARKLVILWAALPPLIVMFAEDRLLGTDYVARAVGGRFTGWVDSAFDIQGLEHARMVIDGEHLPSPANGLAILDPVGYLTAPGLWIGLLIAAGLTWGAIEVRRRRTEG